MLIYLLEKRNRFLFSLHVFVKLLSEGWSKEGGDNLRNLRKENVCVIFRIQKMNENALYFFHDGGNSIIN